MAKSGSAATMVSKNKVRLMPEIVGVSSDPMDLRCPECESSRIARVPRLMVLIIALPLIALVGHLIDQDDLALAGVIAVALIIAFTPSHRCAACGERFNAIEPEEDDAEAPLPLASDTIEEVCPRCGSREVYRVDHRRTY